MKKPYPIWHPFTQMGEWDIEKEVVITGGKGSYLIDTNGRKYLDGNSSLWVNLHGHRHPVITRAIKSQLDRIAHSTLLGLANEPSWRLAQELIKVAPKGLTRVFYSDNGATSVEVAIKMAYQYWRHLGRPHKRKFVRMAETYHGDTLGAVSVGGVSLFHETFKSLLFKTFSIPSYHCLRCPWNKAHLPPEVRFTKSSSLAPSRGACHWECIGEVEKLLKARHGEIAAIIVEPKIQGAAGMFMAPEGYLRKLKGLCRRFDVLLIVDEVAVGFGRTGKMFACEHDGVRPDLMCVAKGLTGGYLPMAATLTTERIYRVFLGRFDEWKTFFHGHSYTGNQVGAAAALANLSVFKSQRLLPRLQPKIRFFRKLLKPLASLPNVGDVRQSGMIAAIEMVKNRRTMEGFPLAERAGQRLCSAMRKDGVMLRPLGNVIPLVPPLSISKSELTRLCGVVHKHLENFDVSGSRV